MNLTIEAKLALKSSLHIKYLSRKLKHHFILGYEVILKKYPWWTVLNRMPMFQIGLPSVIWKFNEVIQVTCGIYCALNVSVKYAYKKLAPYNNCDAKKA